MTFIWIIIFIVSLAALVKGSDWMIDSAEKIGLAIGFSPFVVGIVIVGVGTSLPELISSMTAVFRGVDEIVVANAVGSNIANILLVVGAAAVAGRHLVVSKNLIDLDLPLLALTTVLFLGVAQDGKIVLAESILLLGAYIIYLLYSILHKDDVKVAGDLPDVIPAREEKFRARMKRWRSGEWKVKVNSRDIFLLFVGMAALAIGAKYLIDSVIALSAIFGIAEGAIAISAVALGTSLPELFVAIRAAMQKKSDIVLGNIFGSNVFNILVVVGIPGLVGTLHLDSPTFLLGLPAMILATFLFVISGISRKIHIWEGAFYLMLYLLFIGKLFDLI